MRNYELLIVIQPDLDETAVTEINNKITGWITDANGNVEKTDIWGKRRLAYQIRKQREGQYVLFQFSVSPTFTIELERNIRFLEPVMRHMVTLVE
jgi:small subunit ribosomal protein S6